jgi:hypothetical protein
VTEGAISTALAQSDNATIRFAQNPIPQECHGAPARTPWPG